VSTVVGRVAAIGRYPVKSMQGESPATAVFDATGMLGDRRYGIIDADTGRVLSAKRVAALLEARATLPGADGDRPEVTLPDGTVLAPDADPAHVDRVLSDWLARPVRLAASATVGATSYEMSFEIDDEDKDLFEVPTPPERFIDLAQAHLLTTASLAAAEAGHPGGDWSPHRFRPSILIETDGAEGFVENDWVDRTLALGGLEVSIFMPAIRCVMTTRPQSAHDLPQDKQIARTVADLNGSNLGSYAGVVTPGTVSVGDEVRLLD
jgi:uncharacterized protein YcbX